MGRLEPGEEKETQADSRQRSFFGVERDGLVKVGGGLCVLPQMPISKSVGNAEGLPLHQPYVQWVIY